MRHWLLTSDLPDPSAADPDPRPPGARRRTRRPGLPRWRVALEYEGRQHAEHEQFGRDIDRYSLMAADGWLVLRFAGRHLGGPWTVLGTHPPRARQPRLAPVTGRDHRVVRADDAVTRPSDVDNSMTRRPEASAAEELLQGGQHQERLVGSRRWGPSARSARRWPRRRPTPAADLQVVALQQLRAHRGRVDAVGHPHRGQLGQPVPLGREELQAHLLQAVVQQPAGLGVPRVRPRPGPPRGSGRARRAARRPSPVGAVWW